MVKHHYLVRLVALTMSALLFCSGCSASGAPTKPESASKLTQSVTFEGITIGYPSDWTPASYSSKVFKLINLPDSNGSAKITTYTKGETSSVQSASSAGGNNGLYSDTSYAIETSWTDDGTDFKIVSGTVTSDSLTIEQMALIGYRKDDDKGFIVNVSLVGDGITGENRELADAIVKTVSFDPDQLTTDSADEMQKNINSSSSSSSTGSAGSTSTPSSSYKAGSYVVGKTLPAGEYRLKASGSGYFCVYPDANKDDIVGNNNFGGADYVTVTDGQVLEMKNCTATPAADARVTQSNSLTQSGLYKVGVDCPAGTYSLSSGTKDSGYYAIYDSSAPDADIVENNNFQNSDVAVVAEGQYLEISSCTAALE